MLLCLTVSIMTGCSKSIHPTGEPTALRPGGLVSGTGQPLEMSGFPHAAGDADFILVGEGHTNACDHEVQASILRSLAKSGMRPTVGLEMVTVDRQPVLDRFHDKEIPLARLAETLDWSGTWGYAYEMYEPLFRIADTYDLPVVALNLNRDLVGRFGRKGREGLTPEEQARLPERIIPPSGEQREALAAQFAMHAGMLDNREKADKARQRFFNVQSLWDSQMADRALKARRRFGNPVVLFAGAGHVEYGWGIEYRLQVLAPEYRCVRVIPLRDSEDLALLDHTGLSPTRGGVFGFYCPSRHRSRLGLDLKWEEGVAQVTEVRSGSRAERAGFQIGDLLKLVNGREIKSPTDLHMAGMEAFKEEEPLVFEVLRKGRSREISVDLEKKE
jgi:uncharacterized iron-regulated protein